MICLGLCLLNAKAKSDKMGVKFKDGLIMTFKPSHYDNVMDRYEQEMKDSE